MVLLDGKLKTMDRRSYVLSTIRDLIKLAKFSDFELAVGVKFEDDETTYFDYSGSSAFLEDVSDTFAEQSMLQEEIEERDKLHDLFKELKLPNEPK